MKTDSIGWNFLPGFIPREHGWKHPAMAAAGVICLMILAGAAPRADELITRGGDRLIGQILAETPDYVEFHSDDVGTVRVARSAVARLERIGPSEQGVPPAATAPAGAAAPERPAPAGGTTVLAKPMSAVPAALGEQAGSAPEPGQATEAEVEQMDETLSRFNPLRGWKTSFRFGLLSRRGRDSDTSIDLGYRSQKIDSRDREYQLELRYYRKDNVDVDNSRTTSDNNLTGEFRFRSHFRPRWFYQTNTRYYRDPIVNLLNEGTQTGGVGYWLLDGKQARLSVGPAAGIQYTEYTTENGWHFVAGIYQDLEWRFLKSFKIREGIYYLQDPWNKAQHAVRLNLEVSQSLSRILSLGFSWDYSFEGEVGGNVTQNQQRMGLSLGFDFDSSRSAR
jgi:hypothetical protein